jgi:hypothetical protein
MVLTIRKRLISTYDRSMDVLRNYTFASSQSRNGKEIGGVRRI